MRENGVEADPYGSIREALLAARESAKRDGVALVCLGSLYTYCSVIEIIEKAEGKK